jgi:hypothetical protein
MPVVIDEVVAEMAPESRPAPAPAAPPASADDARAVLRLLRREAWRRARLEAR